ncbi:hypothetical protein P4238_15840 [Pseudomonas aeruginosa]|nr:hypothetical protein [Pseudomonas aeruginosa]
MAGSPAPPSAWSACVGPAAAASDSITDGERWMLVDAPVGAVVTYASWYARLWSQERQTLQAFIALLGIARFFGAEDETLPALLDESLQHQEAVTDALGEQVRRAVEVLIQALDKEDRDRSRTLLQGVEPAELYEAGLTIMMRLVFMLSAEERGLLLMGDEIYESDYAISTLRTQLRQETEEVLEHRHDAWARLLATFRAVYGGIEHETRVCLHWVVRCSTRIVSHSWRGVPRVQTGRSMSRDRCPSTTAL